MTSLAFLRFKVTMTMGQKYSIIRCELRNIAFLLKMLPWVDYVLASSLLILGVTASFYPDLVVIKSNFRIFEENIFVMSKLFALSGALSFYAAFVRNQNLRSVFGLFSLWMFATLFAAVSTFTGHIAWGALMTLQGLLCAALITFVPHHLHFAKR